MSAWIQYDLDLAAAPVPRAQIGHDGAFYASLRGLAGVDVVLASVDPAKVLGAIDGLRAEAVRVFGIEVHCPHCNGVLDGEGRCPHGVLAAADACATGADLCPECGLSDDGCECQYVLTEAGKRALDEPASGDVPAIVAEACAADLAGANR